jgi:hypothetical protein
MEKDLKEELRQEAVDNLIYQENLQRKNLEMRQDAGNESGTEEQDYERDGDIHEEIEAVRAGEKRRARPRVKIPFKIFKEKKTEILR